MGTFNGIEMAKRALFTQQSAIYTTGHNISNANTEGYSRQRVNFEATTPFPSGSRNRPQIPGQMGTGVQAGSVERIRDKFLDLQFRAENSKSGYWESMSEAIGRMESVMNEPSENGLANTMDKFWQSLEDLSVNPENSGARSVAVQRGIAVAETFNHLSDSLTSIQTDLKKEIDVTIEDANSILRQIDGINNQIRELEPHGYLANDLYDERDRLIDELSNIVNIRVEYDKSGESSPDIADGLVSIQMVNDKGQPFDEPIYLLNGKPGEAEVHELSLDEDSVHNIKVGNKDFPISSETGKLSGLINAHGYTVDGEVHGAATNFTSMLNDLNQMAKVFADEFNRVHNEGHGLVEPDGDQNNFFTYDEDNVIGTLRVEEAIIDNPDLIAASQSGSAGNGENALKLAEVFTRVLTTDDENNLGKKTSVKGFYESLIGSLGVTAQEANRMASNTDILRSQVEDQRMSVSSVSLDEEMSNMIKFQHAYNAAARSMTTMDEMLDRIINNMGLVGR
ncbi:flagellar hook-associated protein FlgK [Ornithinibacillus sp. L9]|uniref:Flagellar hook-associated protein 1 n=1 Tax=Ornithinibacillus caprae TaxID=2678566 RepID=A0A6N8FPZ9_9BACI|nr:flagellar hook-associated protein FlgK [Ornithinibacillus caprae]MUK90804.1 flagellar hook-associated protein FlgK [Ornithinibacillus caprae]